jgi:hypothetical protein
MSYDPICDWLWHYGSVAAYCLSEKDYKVAVLEQGRRGER